MNEIYYKIYDLSVVINYYYFLIIFIYFYFYLHLKSVIYLINSFKSIN